jgi:endonuclease/exonuclease/phosphatase family metal-dependent hydrolase
MAAPPEATTRVCTFNIRYGTARDGANSWDERKELVLHVMQALDADIVGLQECLPFQAEYLRAGLPEYDFFGVGREDGVHGEMVPLLSRRERWNMLTGGHFWLSPTPHLPGSRGWDTTLPRMTTWAVLQGSGGNGPPCWVFNTHLDQEGREARRQSALLLRARIDALADRLPALIVGDFNAEPGSPELTPFFAAPRTTALHDMVGTPDGTLHHFTGQPFSRRIDWILASAHWQAHSARVDRTAFAGRYPSDHFPVVADLRLDSDF